MKNKTKCLFIYATDSFNDRFLVKSDLLMTSKTFLLSFLNIWLILQSWFVSPSLAETINNTTEELSMEFVAFVYIAELKSFPFSGIPPVSSI